MEGDMGHLLVHDNEHDVCMLNAILNKIANVIEIELQI